MKRIIYFVCILLLLTHPAYALNYWYESKSVGSTTAVVGTTTFNVALYDKYVGTDVYGSIVATYQPESFNIRYRYDGTSPTSTEGFILTSGSILTLDKVEHIRNFKMCGVGGTATVKTGYVEMYP